MYYLLLLLKSSSWGGFIYCICMMGILHNVVQLPDFLLKIQWLHVGATKPVTMGLPRSRLLPPSLSPLLPLPFPFFQSSYRIFTSTPWGEGGHPLSSLAPCPRLFYGFKLGQSMSPCGRKEGGRGWSTVEWEAPWAGAKMPGYCSASQGHGTGLFFPTFTYSHSISLT